MLRTIIIKKYLLVKVIHEQQDLYLLAVIIKRKVKNRPAQYHYEPDPKKRDTEGRARSRTGVIRISMRYRQNRM